MKVIRTALAVLTLAAAGMGSAAAHDSGVGFSISIGSPGFYSGPPVVSYGPPVVYYPPPTVYYRHYEPRVYYRSYEPRHRHGWGNGNRHDWGNRHGHRHGGGRHHWRHHRD